MKIISIVTAYDGERTLTINPPLELKVTRNVDDEYLEAEDKEFNLLCYGLTMEELRESIEEDLFFLWDCYAQDDPANLSLVAQELREFLLSRMKVTPDV